MSRIYRFNPILHEDGCEQGYMFKTTLRDNNGKPLMFVVIDEEGLFNFSLIRFTGLCSHCGQEFTVHLLLDALFNFKEVG